MIGVVVVGTVADHDVRLPVADEARDPAAVLQRHHQLAVVVVEHLGLDAEDPRRVLGLRPPAQGQGPAGDDRVADVAVGHRHALDLVAEGGPLRSHAGRVQLAVVGMRAEGDDAQLAVRGGGRTYPGGRRHERRQRGQSRPETHLPCSRVADHAAASFFEPGGAAAHPPNPPRAARESIPLRAQLLF